MKSRLSLQKIVKNNLNPRFYFVLMTLNLKSWKRGNKTEEQKETLDDIATF